MQAMKTLPLPTPKVRTKKNVQARIDDPLGTTVYLEADKRHIKIKQIVEYGFRHWLLMVNPKEAERIGITGTEEAPRK